MPILAAYLFPHPPLAVPAEGKGQEKMIAKTLAALDEAGREIAALRPETIIFVTPHGTVYADYFHISPGRRAQGDLARFHAHGERITVKYDGELTEAVSKAAAEHDIPAGTMGEQDGQLDHGFFVPAWFINRHFSQYEAMRISPSGLGVACHYRFGQSIAAAVRQTGRRTVLVASGDLSHRLTADGSHGFAPEGPKFDAEIAAVFADGDFARLLALPASLRERAAECGYGPMVILAGCFDGLAVTTRLLSYEGPFGVGYAVAAITTAAAITTTAATVPGRDFLCQYEQMIAAEADRARQGEDAYQALARRSLEHVVENNGETLPLAAVWADLPPELTARRAGAFVTLYKEGRLRGCIGTIAPATASLAEEIVRNAVSAALHDNRFEQVTAAELPFLSYKVDVLGEAEQIADPAMLDVKRYGVIVTSGHKRGLLLPNLDGIDSIDEQIAIARRKGGIGEHESVILERFEVVRHES